MTKANPNLVKIKMDWPEGLMQAICRAAAAEDENVSAFVRRVVAREVGWIGPTRNIRHFGLREEEHDARSVT